MLSTAIPKIMRNNTDCRHNPTNKWLLRAKIDLRYASRYETGRQFCENDFMRAS